ncbi:PPE domain-containing protein [Mycobacterium sp. Aquia_216]|uniref:PPE domain-containing protein n=1 Tax=Mycobacterium sp. Aquia_216 TaxID=2991729 RepID=UPI00227A74B3|nr:PPE domain-containing protein [Mycobacterium sp. Aquia_216]WAJ46362.1 PPE domain-containing protein [Mycobacterium sp. Aquia_216]
MGFTNVAWESRSAEQLARDLTDGPGPMSVGQAGAAWVRVADEWASISEEYDRIVEKIKSAFTSRGADVGARKLEDFGRWLQSVSLSAAGNGERAEDAAVAYSVAVLGMPSVSEAIDARTTHDVMASLAAYNGAILNGQFAEFDQTVATHQANASAVMYQYEEACAALAQPWDQPIPPAVFGDRAVKAEQAAKAADEGTGAGAKGGGGASLPPPPLASFRAAEVRSTSAAKEPHKIESMASASGAGPVGTGYGPMGALGRGTNTREHPSSLEATLDGGGEPGAGLSPAESSWLPATQQSDAPFTVSHVSWGPNTSVFDQPAGPVQPEPPQFADAPQPTLEQVSDRWVSPPVIGVDKGLTL